MGKIRLNSIWRHTNGNLYQVMLITNIESKSLEHPETIVYKNIYTRPLWSIASKDWHRSMKPFDDPLELEAIFGVNDDKLELTIYEQN